MSGIAGVLRKLCLLILVLTAAAQQTVSAASGVLQAHRPADYKLYDPALLQRAGYFIPEKGCALFIDLDNYNMIVFVDGQPFKAYPVSGGTPDAPSPTGTWMVTEIANWGEGFGGSWIGLNVPWGKYGIHGTVEPWALGEYNASHGCIRMKDEDVAEVKKLVTHGTVVFIKHDGAPFRALENGMVGSDVMKTQRMLKKMGFYTGAADGVFGSGMERAVRGFQRTYSLEEDGIVGRRTYEKISEQYELSGE